MYTVYLIDDEPWVLKGLRKSIDWTHLGFDVIGDSISPSEAIRAIQKCHPDVIFCDIRMPGMSGIEMMQKLRESGIDSEFVVLSGFAEFGYAKEAIKYGAFHYLLKPLDKAECEDMLRRLLQKLHAKKIISSRLLSPSFFETVYGENPDMVSALQKENLPCNKKLYQALILKGSPYDLIAQYYFNHITDYLIFMYGWDKYAVILNADVPIAAQDIQAGPQHIGISTASEYPGDLPRLIEEGNTCCSIDFYAIPEMVVQEYHCPDQESIASASVQLFRAMFSDGGKEMMQQYMKEYVHEHNLTLEEFFILYKNLLALIQTDTNQADDIESFEELISEFGCLDSCVDYLSALAHSATQASLASEDVTANTFQNIKNYIGENYMQAVTLSDISGLFHLNLTYICDLFKKNSQTTFSAYLKCIRLEKAKELLVQTGDSITEIAGKVGYDALYFSKLFKEVYHISPLNYRKTIRS